MNFEKLKIKNFLTVGEAEIDLSGRGLLLIQGVNLDDTSTTSNGAGKSSVMDALCWANYGTTARDVTGDDVINDTAGKNCSVTVTLRDNASDDFVYRIERYRKHSTNKNQLLVFKVPDDSTTPINLSKGTDRETQEVVTKLIGCSLEVFTAAVYSGQEAMPDLPGMTDKMLKTLIEQAAGVEVLTEAYSVARNRQTAAKSTSATWNTTNANYQARLLALDSELSTMQADSVAFEVGRKDRAKLELAKVIPVKAQIADFKTQAEAFDEVEIGKESALLQVKLDSYKTEQNGLQSVQAAHQKLDRDAVRLATQLAAAKNEVARADKAVMDVDSQVGTPCGECGKEYHAEDLATAKKLRFAAAAEARGKEKDVAALLATALIAATEAKAVATTFEVSMTDISLVAIRQRTLNAQLATLTGIKTSIKTMEFEVVRHNDTAKVKLTETNPWTKVIESKKVDRADVVLKVADVAVSTALADAELEMLNDAVTVFGPAGVRAHILDTVTPYLNDRTQEYLGAISDGNIHATWSTLTKTAKGELREKFNIEVSNDKGAKSFKGLSGGEKRKVRLASALALQDMVASRATKPIGIFIGDEIDDALDPAGLERLMGILERKAKERGTVLVISHNSLTDWIDDIVTVTKKDGYATMSGENIRT